jgi:hypothetical protein
MGGLTDFLSQAVKLAVKRLTSIAHLPRAPSCIRRPVEFACPTRLYATNSNFGDSARNPDEFAGMEVIVLKQANHFFTAIRTALV